MKTRRCAIYTRKSTDENMSLEFTSLDNQRMRAEAYIKSQPDWECIETRYDDAGFTGGDMNRPALKRLLADIEMGEIDVVLVYKSDRMTRSVSDLMQLVQLFDEYGITYTSVTEGFSTASSSGRMFLSMISTFAQYERELISERTAHKIAAARERGQWTGGRPLLGYDIERDERGSRLIVNQDEAPQVAALFDLYIEHESLLTVAKIANERGWHTKEWTTKAGRTIEGKPFDKPTIHAILKNVTYIGMIAHRENVYKGQHQGIVDPGVFDRVKFLLQRNALSGGREVRNKHGALLRGLLYCRSCKCAMSHSYTKKGDVLYRYYVCGRAQKSGYDSCPTKSIPAVEVEKYIVEQIKSIGNDDDLTTATIAKVRRETDAQIAQLTKERTRLVKRINKHHAQLSEGGSADDLAPISEQAVADERRLAEVEAELDRLQTSVPSSDEIDHALREFEPVWSALTPKEQAKLVGLLIHRIEYDGAEGEIAITYQPTSLRVLSDVCTNATNTETAA